MSSSILPETPVVDKELTIAIDAANQITGAKGVVPEFTRIPSSIDNKELLALCRSQFLVAETVFTRKID